MFALRWKYIFPLIDTSTNYVTNQKIGLTAIVLVLFLSWRFENATRLKVRGSIIAGIVATVVFAGAFGTLGSLATGASDTAGILEHMGLENVRAGT